MVEMAKAHDVSIHHYLAYVMEQRPDDTWSDEQLEQIAPWNENLRESIKQRMNTWNESE